MTSPSDDKTLLFNTDYYYRKLLLQFLDLHLDHGRDLPRGWDVEPVHVEDGDLVPLAGPELEGYYLRLSLLAGDLDDAGEVVGGGGDDGAGPGAGQEEGEVSPGDQEVAGGEETCLINSLTGRQVDGVALLLNLLHVRHVVVIVVVQAEHVPGVLVQFGASLVEVNMFGFWGRIVPRAVDVVDEAVLQVGRFLLEIIFDGVQFVW